jgi:regulator of sirC expression with transglutaminase-like and TPR domain
MTNENKLREIQALISLIDEPDPEIFSDISQNIFSFGIDIVPFLEHAWENQHQPEMQKRIETLIHQIQYDQVCKDLFNWTADQGKDLLRGSLIIARYQYPDLIEEEVEYEISRIRKDVWIELNDNLTALEQIRVFNYVFYEVHGFAGNTTNYHASQNSFLNKVLETRKGNPLSISIIYMLVAQSLDIPIHGINLPEHFVLAYTGNTINPDTLEYSSNNVLFYINAFSRGMVFSYKDVEVFLKQLNQESKPEYFLPCTNIDIIKRMLNNLINAYKKAGEEGKVKEIQYLFEIVNKHSKTN